MGIFRGPVYSSVSQINGPSGWYKVHTSEGVVTVWVDQDYDGGGWIMALANRSSTAGMNNLKYTDAINNCNYRINGSNNATNDVQVASRALLGKTYSDVNSWLGLKFWLSLTGRDTVNKITITQYVSNSIVPLSSTGSHVYRSKWTSSGFSSTYGFTGVGGIVNQVGGTTPGMYSHASSGYSLTTYDNDQDTNGGNCSTYYNNNPWWYSSCWTGNYFAGGGYQDRPYWVSSGGLNYAYGAVYIK